MHAFKLSIVTGIAAVALFAVSGTAQAARSDAEVVSSGFLCKVLMPETPFARTTDSLLTVDSNGNETLICRFDSTNPSGSEIVLTGFGCTTTVAYTTMSTYTLSASGQGLLVCHFPSS